jgi:hypothetical protein
VLRGAGQATVRGLGAQFHTTALINRADLLRPGDCGEARLSYAASSAYRSRFQRMTIIIELRVPDDGTGCRQAAQRWAELSMIDDPATRRERLKALYDELLVPERLAQVRTNEFFEGRSAPWELREWHRGAGGLLELAPAAQAVDPRFAKSPALIAWARGNLAALRAGTATVPTEFLAAVSVENGGRVKLESSDRSTALRDAEQAINALSCAGCHMTETKSPFVHIGERMGKGGQPDGRAVIDELLVRELPGRARHLRDVLRGGAGQRLSASGRVH